MKEELKETDSIRALKEENRKKIESMRQNRDLVLSLVEHTYTNCSDKHPCNGIEGAANMECVCPRCGLIEIMDGTSEDIQVLFDVSFTGSAVKPTL